MASNRRRRRWRGAAGLVIALLLTGTASFLCTPRPQLAQAASDSGAALAGQGEQLYDAHCISCHGENLQGIPDRGPGLVGVGQAAVYFQVSTGRMPLARPHSTGQAPPVDPQFDAGTTVGQRNLAALGAFVEEHGGGPMLPPGPGSNLVGTDVAGGGQLFRLNCASCHNFTGRGGPLTEGRFAPALAPASPEQMYAAMLSGPLAMPRFSDAQLSPKEKSDIIAYVLAVRGQNNSPGGFNLGEWGPLTEGLVAFVVGVVALVALAAWIGMRS